MKSRLPTYAIILAVFLFLTFGNSDFETNQSITFSGLVGYGVHQLMIAPVPEQGARFLFKATDGSLRLVCTVISDPNGTTEYPLQNATELTHFDLKWHLPISTADGANRVFRNGGLNTLQLAVENLRESDAGEYRCTATGKEAVGTVNSESLQLSGSIHVFVNPRIVTSRMMMRACKFLVNCSTEFVVECCDKPTAKVGVAETNLPKYTNRNSDPAFGPQQDMADLQATVYTAIGCGMIFLIVITGIVIIICRLHMKRTSGPYRRPLRNPLDLASWDHFMQSVNNREPGRFLVSFHAQNGLGALGSLANPPSYEEVLQSSPHAYGPPPPYSSTENVNEEPGTLPDHLAIEIPNEQEQPNETNVETGQAITEELEIINV